VIGFLPKGHVGNVAKEISAFLQPIMRHPFGSVACVGDNTYYSSGCFFSCVLSYENFSHTPHGYSSVTKCCTNLNHRCDSGCFTNNVHTLRADVKEVIQQLFDLNSI
jgi:hypothetical protein